MKKFTHLFSPIKIGSITLKNRIEAAPMAIANHTAEGYLTSENIAVYEARAKGGAALINMGEAQIDHLTGISHEMLLPLEDPCVLPSLLAATDAIRRHNAVSCIELVHPGTRSNPDYYDGPMWGPSAGPGHLGVDYSELDEETINYIVEKFGDAAEMAKLGGVDMIMIHGGHGWLLHQFLSPLNNRRTDKFGGSLENRARIYLMVIENIREKCGLDYPIELRMSGTELVEGGLTLEDQIEFVKLLDGKVDLFHVSSGTFHVPETNLHMFPSMFLEKGCNVYLAEAIKKVVKTPVITVGALGDPDMMEQIIAEGKADMVGLARPLIADPDLPNKLKCGHDEDVTPCLRCEACISESFVPYVKYASKIVRCTVNPTSYREFALQNIQPAKDIKNVLVIGGGPAGMEAAITLSDRGHNVTLCEKTDSLGGALKFAKHVSFKEDLEKFMNVLINRVQKRKIYVMLNTTADEKIVEIVKPDVIIAALGAESIVPNIPGIDKENVVMAVGMHEKANTIGDNVVIIGGGLVGCEEGLHLASLGKKVTIVEMKKEIGRDAPYLHREAVLLEMKKYNLEVITKVVCNEITDNGIVVTDTEGNVKNIDADTVIVAAGLKALESEAESFRDKADYFWRIGDCLKARKVYDAMREGYNAGIDI